MLLHVVLNFSDEDAYGSYSKLLLKYFMAEGVVNGHELFLASGDTSPEEFLQVLVMMISIFQLSSLFV